MKRSQNEPKYLPLMNWIRQQITGGAFVTGDRLPSEKELGDMFAISRQTVRQATSVLENEGMLERRRGSGTYIAAVSAPLRSTTMSIGVITTYLDDYIFPSIIKGIDTILTQNGYTMQLAITYNKIENEMRILSGLLKNDVDGIIIEPTKSGLPSLNAELYEELRNKGIPCLFINGYYPGMAFPFVAMDDAACGQAAARYLLEHKHTKIAGVFKADDIQGHLRYAGCAKWLKQHGYFIHDDNIMWYTTEDIQMFATDNFAARLLARIAGCSAIICYNDQIAQRIMKILADHGLTVPGDFSLISFDNSDIGTGAPVGLTTFSHPKEELGKTAAANLLRLINREKFEATVRFAPELVERDSVQTLKDS